MIFIDNLNQTNKIFNNSVPHLNGSTIIIDANIN